MSLLLEPGTYQARAGGQVIIYEAQSGALCAAVPCEVTDGPSTGVKIKHTMTLVKSDGTVQTRTTDTIKDVFGWDGQDPFWLMDTDLTGKAFEIVVESEQGTDGNTYAKVQWLNPVGGGPGMKMPAAADRRSVLAKYGSKFRALAGGAPVKAPAPPVKKPSPPPPQKQPELPTGPVSTMEEAWAELCQVNEGKPEAELQSLWFATVERLFPGKTNSDLTPQDWGKVKASFEDKIPM